MMSGNVVLSEAGYRGLKHTCMHVITVGNPGTLRPLSVARTIWPARGSASSTTVCGFGSVHSKKSQPKVAEMMNLESNGLQRGLCASQYGWVS
jgi:hypothetical protein